MIERLIAASLRFRGAVIAGTLALVTGGVWSLVNIRVDAFPDLTPNQVQVITTAPGLSSNEVENLVSYPLETAMMGLPRTQLVRSISKSGISVVTVSYDDDVDTYFAPARGQQFHVQADPTKLASYGITLRDLEQALKENNANFGAGYLESHGERFTIRGLGRLGSADDVGNVVVATRAGVPIYVRDAASVEVGAMPREGAVSRDGRGGTLAGMIVLLKGAHGREVVARVEQRLTEIRGRLPRGVRVRPFYNQGDVVDRTSRTLVQNLLEGGLLVTLILFLFLRNVRASLITASGIPLSLLAAFFLMQRIGVSANLMSLGALDFGLLVARWRGWGGVSGRSW